MFTLNTNDQFSIMVSLANYKGFIVEGYSRAAHRTGIIIRGLDIVLDAGLDVQKAFSHVFISHQHYDHVLYLPQYAFNTTEEKIMNIISTEKILSNVKPWFISAVRMTKDINSKTRDDTIMKIVSTEFKPVKCEEVYEFKNGTEKWKAELIKCFHSVDSVGFGFCVEKKKLKTEYKDLSQKEIKQLVKNNIEITAVTHEKMFLFLGDTDKHILTNDNIYEYPTIIMECTYIYTDEENLARKNRHIHWNDIKNIVVEKQHIQFILIHFSMKYTNQEIKDFFGELKLNNVNLIL